MKFCPAPDRDVPGLRCGFPMPCHYHTETGARKLRMVLLLEARAKHVKGAPMRPVRIFGISLGPRWRHVCEKYLSAALR